MCHRPDLHVAPNGGNNHGMVRGYKHAAPLEQKLTRSLKFVESFLEV